MNDKIKQYTTTPTKKMLTFFPYLREPIPIRIIINQL